MKKMQMAYPLALLMTALTPCTSALAAAITNGGFETGDFTGWSLDTDGFPGSANDFQVVGSPGNYRARIEADFPSNDVFFANTLFQELDTSADPGDRLMLSFDWVFGGEDGDPIDGESFLVALGDGTGSLFDATGSLGSLLGPTASYGSGSYSTSLDFSTFANTAGWTVEFQLMPGFGFNGLGSFLEIENVELEAVPAQVSQPGVLALLSFGLVGLMSFRRR